MSREDKMLSSLVALAVALLVVGTLRLIAGRREMDPDPGDDTWWWSIR